MPQKYLLLSVLVLDYIKGATSIEGGFNYTTPKPYIAYIVNAYTTKNVAYMDWLCGGAIVSENFILTSAACAQDSLYMYAIAGYDTYVNAKDLKDDACTSKVKKKIVYTCVPKTYQFDYQRVDLWANIDIALVRVESPYDFKGPPVPGCSWAPDMIKVNYKEKYQEPGQSTLLFGWGHTRLWRSDKDATMYNQKMLQYTHTTIIDKTTCKESYENETIHPIIDKYMICTNGSGQFDDQGVDIDDTGREVELNNDGCKKLSPALRSQCEQRENNLRSHVGDRSIRWDFRRNGICQNDHGGPITTFAGSQEILLGVASVFLITRDRKCTGPYLHTSTFCNSAFISCILNGAENSTTNEQVDNGRRTQEVHCPDIPPPEISGIRLMSRRISWAKHPDGPAANELDQDLFERQQIPLRSLS